jgi:hypothetical protein
MQTDDLFLGARGLVRGGELEETATADVSASSGSRARACRPPSATTTVARHGWTYVFSRRKSGV